jgi:adenylate cyclase
MAPASRCAGGSRAATARPISPSSTSFVPKGSPTTSSRRSSSRTAKSIATWTTRQPGGFTEAQLTSIETVLVPLSRLTEVYALRRTAANLLDAHVGREAGERILGGQIRRGDSEAIEAAIWLSDMRGFTALSEALPPAAVIDVLNRFFDCQVPAIAEHGGEVLKFQRRSAGNLPGRRQGPYGGAALSAAWATSWKIAADGGLGRDCFGVALHVGKVCSAISAAATASTSPASGRP